jgi:hypothetical protein
MSGGAETPEAILMRQEWLAAQHATESKGLSLERHQFFAQDVLTANAAKFVKMFGQTVANRAQATRTYRDGFGTATR